MRRWGPEGNQKPEAASNEKIYTQRVAHMPPISFANGPKLTISKRGRSFRTGERPINQGPSPQGALILGLTTPLPRSEAPVDPAPNPKLQTEPQGPLDLPGRKLTPDTDQRNPHKSLYLCRKPTMRENRLRYDAVF